MKIQEDFSSKMPLRPPYIAARESEKSFPPQKRKKVYTPSVATKTATNRFHVFGLK
jgi:hypothetical protein